MFIKKEKKQSKRNISPTPITIMQSLKKTESYAESTQSTTSTIASIKSKAKNLATKLKGKTPDNSKRSNHTQAMATLWSLKS